MSIRKQIRAVFDKYPLIVAVAVLICYIYDNKTERKRKLKEFLSDSQIASLQASKILDENLRQNEIKKENKKLDIRAVEVYNFFKEKYKEKFQIQYITYNEKNEISLLQSLIWTLAPKYENPVEVLKSAILKSLNENDNFLRRNSFNLKLFIFKINKYLMKGENTIEYKEKPKVNVRRIETWISLVIF